MEHILTLVPSCAGIRDLQHLCICVCMRACMRPCVRKCCSAILFVLLLFALCVCIGGGGVAGMVPTRRVHWGCAKSPDTQSFRDNYSGLQRPPRDSILRANEGRSLDRSKTLRDAGTVQILQGCVCVCVCVCVCARRNSVPVMPLLNNASPFRKAPCNAYTHSDRRWDEEKLSPRLLFIGIHPCPCSDAMHPTT